MAKIMLNPTETSQWQNLINDASKQINITLDEQLESYLVFTLMKFINAKDATTKVLAIDYLENLNLEGKQQFNNMRDIGDHCLLFAGLFPGMAKKRRVKISYYVNIGQTAYSNAAENSAPYQLYTRLADNFVLLMDILQTTRELDSDVLSLDPSEAQELWLDTNSEHAKSLLKGLGNVTSILPYLNIRH